MCDAEYINKEQLKVIKLKKLLKKWDDNHFQQTFNCALEWNWNWRVEHKKKYYEKMLSKLELEKGKLQIRNNLKRYYINKLNEVKAIKGNGEGYWSCYIDENIGVFNNHYDYGGYCVGDSECRTFTEFKNEIKTEILESVDKFMTMPHKEIAEHLQSVYCNYMYCDYTIRYKIIKESRNPKIAVKNIKHLNRNMF